MNVHVHTTRAIACWLLMLMANGEARGESSGTTSLQYAAYGRLFTHQTMTSAYAKVKFLYAVDLDSQQCVPVAQLKAQRLRGTVKLATVSRVQLKANDGRSVAVLGIRGPMPKIGDKLDVMVIRSGAETLSVRDQNREVMAISQSRDVTMTFTDFAGFLRNGHHFPQAPELNTQPGRKRLFSTLRVQGSKVAQYLNRPNASSTNRSPVVERRDYDGNLVKP